MTAKEFLSQAYRADLRINTKLEQVRSLRDLATKASAALTGMPFSGTRDVHSMEEVVAKMIDMKDEINAEIINLMELKAQIAAAIEDIPSVEHRVLLEFRYICGKSWTDIAAEMKYSVRNIHILHGAALREAEKVLEKRQAKK